MDAAFRHLQQWWEGVDIDEDSGLCHVVKAIASLTVLMDCIERGAVWDDRPPPSPKGFMKTASGHVKSLAEKYPNPVAPVTNLPL